MQGRGLGGRRWCCQQNEALGRGATATVPRRGGAARDVLGRRRDGTACLHGGGDHLGRRPCASWKPLGTTFVGPYVLPLLVIARPCALPLPGGRCAPPLIDAVRKSASRPGPLTDVACPCVSPPRATALAGCSEHVRGPPWAAP